MRTRLITCSCNGTVAIEPSALERSLAEAGVDAKSALHGSQLCRRELPRVAEQFESTDDVIVACTQESKLFAEVAGAKKVVSPIRFVNLREQAGWGQEGAKAAPKIAALLAMATGAEMDPVAAVGYRSEGRVLLVGGDDALRWGDRLAASMVVTVLLERRAAALSGERLYPVVSGRIESLSGWLGAFDAAWSQSNPIDLEACVRCGACVSACPEQAIGADLQIDMDRCRSHRRCVDACAGIGAIDFDRTDTARTGQFDLVIDFREAPAFAMHQLPQGYFHPGADPDAQAEAALQATRLVGEFDKPKFFRYREKLCAHSRNEIKGCTQCIDVCSAEAIRSDGDRVAVEPHLCVGCGACATVCPSGAMGYAYPTPTHLGAKLRTALAAWRAAAGGSTQAPLFLFHDAEAGARLIESLGRGAGPVVARGGPAPKITGLPARVIPVAVHHVASIGMDLALSALAFGAAQVAVLATGREAPQYLDATRRQFETAQAIVSALGYRGTHLHVIEAGDAASLEAVLQRIEPADTVGRSATFALSEDKRRSIEFAVDHLAGEARLAGRPEVASVPLAAGAPFGTLHIDTAACTLCLACTGACPESALLDNPERPQLRFVERNCVQCGLCERTCPEKAIRLEPRYNLQKEMLAARVLNEAQPFECIGCGKPFGTRQMVENMMGRLSGHGMFGGAALKRLQMCADCRVVDMIRNQSETSIFDVARNRDTQ